MQSQNTIALRTGLYSGLVLIVVGIIFRSANVSVSSGWSWAFYALLPVIAWFAIREFRQQNPDAGFKAQFTVSSYATVIASAIYSVSVMFYNYFVDASILMEAEAYLRQAAVDAGKTGEALAQAYQLADVFTQPVPFVIAVFLQLAVTGVSIALSFALWYRWRERSAPVPSHTKRPVRRIRQTRR